MKFSSSLIVAASLLASAQAEVIKLTESNFDSYVDGSKHAFVEFFAPWCGHCKSLEPEWAIAGNTFLPDDDVVIAAVDATENQGLADKFGVSGYPTIKYFPKGSTEAEDYKGGRSGIYANVHVPADFVSIYLPTLMLVYSGYHHPAYQPKGRVEPQVEEGRFLCH
jgi:protein disulfide-isomerase-like protein